MKTLVIAATVLGALVFAGTHNDQANAGSTNSAWENRVAQVDGFFGDGLTDESHQKITGPAGDGAGAVADFGDRLTSFVP